MTAPRQILPGSTYLVTRRCSERRYFLRPEPTTKAVFGYLLAVATQRFDIEPHCAVVMGNHYHAVVTDWSGRLPLYLAWLHRLVAVVLNVFRGRWEAFWSSSKPSVVRLETASDVLDKMVYVLGNAVAAGLVARAEEWPGFLAGPSAIGQATGREFGRPHGFFSPRGRLPEAARLHFTKPPGFEHLSDEEFALLLRTKLGERERRMADRLKSEGHNFAGAERAGAVDWTDAPSTPTPRRRRDPHLAARDLDVRLQAIERLQEFRGAYREAFRRLRSGKRAVFPAGTYALRRTLGVRCHPPPPELSRPCTS